MSQTTFRIGVVATARTVDEGIVAPVREIARELYGTSVEVMFHRSCFQSSGHFAGDDNARVQALLEVANSTLVDAVWFGRGGYGTCRLLNSIAEGLGANAAGKIYLGYSDIGFLMAALSKRGYQRLAHGPVAMDLRRQGGREAVERALRWMVEQPRDVLEPSVLPGVMTAAFNLTVLSHILGTPFEPDLNDHILMVEDVSEYLYSIDRAFFHVTANANVRKIIGLRLGRLNDLQPNDCEFHLGEEEIALHWCEQSGIPYLGRADIGHDAANKIVPFGMWEG